MSRRTLNAAEDFAALFQTVRRSSWRWECQGWYAVDMPDVERWLRGEPAVETDEDRAWVDYIAGLRAVGVPFARVRMLTDPLTDYLRWMLATTDRNVDAGEDIRWVEQRDVAGLGLPDYDFYVFDDDRVVVLRFDDGKQLVAVELDDDPGVVRQHQQWRDRVWPLAIPHTDYRAGDR
ncbi:DUF6879 family protein [Amycolatopsis thermoflava]|uniref:DUF6879 family protein n=1 Tax=Amycolatopsis thermoflava TaxID=84480 RepID=UPI003F49D9BD